MSNLYIMYGYKPEEMVTSILQEIKIEKDILKFGNNPLIGIKPNLVVAQPAHWGATTSPELVRGVISYLKSKGLTNIVIMESSWIGDSTKKAFENCGYREISEEFNVPLVDLKDDDSQQFTVDGITLNVCKQVLKVDYLINMPVLKAHCQTRLTCALKNLKGCIPDEEKRRFHTLGLHKPIACLNKVLTSNLIVVDGIIGDLTYEGGGTPVQMNRVIVGKDPVLIDTYAAELIGYSVDDIEYITLAERLGIGKTHLTRDKVVELNSNKDAPSANEILASDDVDHLQQWINADEACSACFGSLIHALKRLQEKGQLEKLQEKLNIGQAFRNIKKGGIGVGTCTEKFENNIPGCPPDAKKIVKFLEDYLGCQ